MTPAEQQTKNNRDQRNHVIYPCSVADVTPYLTLPEHCTPPTGRTAWHSSATGRRWHSQGHCRWQCVTNHNCRTDVDWETTHPLSSPAVGMSMQMAVGKTTKSNSWVVFFGTLVICTLLSPLAPENQHRWHPWLLSPVISECETHNDKYSNRVWIQANRISRLVLSEVN